MHKDKNYSNFRDMGKQMQAKEPEPSQQNFAQLINWMAEVKTEVAKYTAIMNDYRLQQMRQAMEMKDHIAALLRERKDIEGTMDMILTHLTAPGGTTSIDGALLPTPDAIAIKVIELMKRPMMIHKSWDYSVREMPDGSQIPISPMALTSSFPPSNDEEKEEVIPASDEVEKINMPIRKRITYSKRMDEMMLEIMQQQGGEWNTNKLIDAMIAKYPHTTFKKPSVATAFTILMNAGTIFRVDRGMYQAKEQARG